VLDISSAVGNRGSACSG